MRLRRDSVLWLVALLGILPMIPALSAISLAGATADAAASHKPNVLSVVFDDLNTRLGCYRDPVAKSPNIDRLAARGVTFHRAYCQQPICGPSRASFMTGRRPNTLGIWSMARYPLDCCPDIKILPEWFRDFHLGKLDTRGKMTLLRLDARVPMIIAAPIATSGGRKTSAISELVDLYPTRA